MCPAMFKSAILAIEVSSASPASAGHLFALLAYLANFYCWPAPLPLTRLKSERAVRILSAA